jgi:hypothetical protein
MIFPHIVGPFYWGGEYPAITWGEGEHDRWLEDALPDQRRVTYSWFVEDQKPYRKSIVGFRIRFTKTYALHVGMCRKAEEPPHKRLVNISPSDIGAWGRTQESEGDDAVHEETSAL